MKLYRFLPSRYALDALQRRVLKVGRLSELNDLIDCVPFVTSVPAELGWDTVSYAEHIAALLDKQSGIICYTTERGLQEPVVWTHYADSHKGIALGFEIPRSEVLKKVIYSNKRPEIEWRAITQEKHFGLARRDVLNTKAKSWKYEHEYRLLVDLAECEPRDGMYFYKFPWESLVDITLGARCPHDRDYIYHLMMHLGSRDKDVRLAQVSDSDFRILLLK